MALKNLFARSVKTTSSVLAHFRKSIDELHEVRQAHHELAEQHEAEANAHLTHARDARLEGNYAAEAIGRLEAVFGVHA